MRWAFLPFFEMMIAIILSDWQETKSPPRVSRLRETYEFPHMADKATP